MTLSQKFFLTASKPGRRSITAEKKRRKGEKGKAKKKFQKSKSLNFDSCACPSHNALKRDAGGKKVKLLCCKPIFDRILGNLAKIQPKNHQNAQKRTFSKKVPGVNGLKHVKDHSMKTQIYEKLKMT